MDNQGKRDGSVIHVRFDTDEPDPSLTVAETVAELEGKDATELDTIYDTIDHIIDNIFSNPPRQDADVEVAFTYEGYRIAIHQDGHATFVPLSEWEGPIAAEH